MRFGIFFVLLCMISSLGFAQSMILMKSHVQTSTETVLKLGDIAEFQQIGSDLQNILKEIVLLQDWSQKTSVNLSSSEVAQLIRAEINQNTELKKINPALKIPKFIYVEKSVALVSNEVVTRQITEEVLKNCEACQVQVLDLKIPKVNAVDEQLQWSLRFDNFKARGPFQIPLVIENSVTQSTYWVTGKLVVQKQLPVARRNLNYGERIQNADIEMKWVDVSFQKSGFASQNEVLGATVGRTLTAGQAVFQGDLKREPAVQRGQIVRVVSGNEAFEVSMTAQAENAGFVGDLVRLKNLETQKFMSGVIVEKGLVKVE